jgi:predicted dehydrogenase
MPRITRRTALKTAAATLAVPFVWRLHAHAAPSETVLHASFGASGMAAGDIGDLTKSKNLKLVAVAEVDDNRVGDIKKRFPDCAIYKDYRELLDKEKKLDSVNVSTPDHMHAPIAMSAMQLGKHVYVQKPMAHTVSEARLLTAAANRYGVVSLRTVQG